MLVAEEDGRRSPDRLSLLLVNLALCVAAGVLIALTPSDQVATLVLVSITIAAAAILTAGRPRGLVVLGAIVYVGVIHWVYVDWVAPVYAYSGLIATGAEWPALAVISILSILPAAWLPTALGRPSDVVLWFLFLFGYVPACSIPIHLMGPDLGAVLPFTMAVALGFATLNLTRRIPPAAFAWPGLTERIHSRLLIGLGLGVAGYLIVIFGIPTRIPNFETVYDARADYAAVANASIGAGYLIPWAGNVIFPFLMAVGLARSKGWMLALGIGGEILVYATTGFKTVLFSIVLVPILYAFVRYGSRGFGVLLSWAGVAVVALSVAGTWVTGSIWPLALFVTRLIAVPGQMTAYYYEFFSTHATLELSRSFLRWFIPAPYDVDPPYLIGAVYLHSPTTDANANIWADAVANFGLLGIVPFTIVLGVVLWILDSASSGRDLSIIAPTLGLAGITLGNGGLFTSILTLGIGLTIGLIVLLPNVGEATAKPSGMARAP